MPQLASLCGLDGSVLRELIRHGHEIYRPSFGRVAGDGIEVRGRHLCAELQRYHPRHARLVLAVRLGLLDPDPALAEWRAFRRELCGLESPVPPARRRRPRAF